MMPDAADLSPYRLHCCMMLHSLEEAQQCPYIRSTKCSYQFMATKQNLNIAVNIIHKTGCTYK